MGSEAAAERLVEPDDLHPDRGSGAAPGERFTRYLEGLRRLSPSHANRASDLGFPCDRHNWYARREHEAAALPDLRLQGILEYGTDYEEMLRRRLMAAGYKLRSEQVTRVWREYNITGHPEGWLSYDDGATWELFEVKSVHPYYYDRVQSWRDFTGPIYSRWVAQGQVYMLLENRDRMLWVLGKKTGYELKWLWMELDYGLAESYIQKAERLNRMVEHGPIPERTTDPEACRVCAWKLHCLPDQDHGPGAELSTDADLLGLLTRRDELAPAAREYEAADKAVKSRVKGKPLVLIGAYEIRGQETTRKGYEVKPATYWTTRILNRATPAELGDPADQPSLTPALRQSLGG